MKQWKVIYSGQAKLDLLNITDDIRYNLLAPQSAIRITDKIMDEIKKLDSMPERFSLYQEDPWYNLGLRFLPVENYTVFYYPESQTGVVQIIRIMYSGQNESGHLPTQLNN